jgi:hypothetical protein
MLVRKMSGKTRRRAGEAQKMEDGAAVRGYSALVRGRRNRETSYRAAIGPQIGFRCFSCDLYCYRPNALSYTPGPVPRERFLCGALYEFLTSAGQWENDAKELDRL